MLGDVLKHVREALLHLLNRGDTGRVDIIQTRANLVGVLLRLEDLEELLVRLGVLDGDDISCKKEAIHK